ncbi:transposase, partial [Glaesserella parasuis]|nr:transposase [Glaesserella parasuis]MDO9942328.1 transposase [Glaesserella parasuis]MDO9952973.1 transposase [Glaesserella parasuis]MDO9963697.1 transposase [Glaesserella parasuis]MDO9965778.1 transposase [Glaesserella parasuis]
ARNGYTSKTVICDEGEIEIETPRDRDGTFEPQLIKKNQTRITGMDEQIIALIATFFDYPADIRKAIYTTNAVESLNSVIRRVIKKRNVFPTDDSVFKVIWLAIKDASKKWTMPIQNWKLAMNRFMIDFGDRLDDHR